jgi:hypothetical protein
VNLKTTLTLVVILAILLAAYFLLPKDQKATLRETGKMVSGYETDRISRIRIENAENNEKIVVTKSGDDWQMDEPLRVPADGVSAKFLADYLANYTGTRVGKVGDAAVKLEALGLAKPRATVEFQQKGPDEKAPSTTIVCKIGSDNVKGDKVFLQVGDVVYEAPRTIYNSVAKHADEFRDHRIFTLGQWEVDQVELTRAGATTILKLEDGVWQFLAPFKGRADALACGKLAGIAALRVSKFENDLPTDLAKYGLEPPDSTLTLRTKQKAQTLRIGKSQEDRTFVQRDGLGQVWGVSEAELAPIRKTADELRDLLVFGHFTNENVKLLHWRLGETEIEITQDPVTRRAKLSKPRDAELDRDAFEAVLKGLDDLRAESAITAAGANLTEFGLAPPFGFLELQLKDANKPTRLDVGATRPEGAFVRREGDDYLLRVPAAAFAFLSKAVTDLVSKELVHIDSYDPGQVEIDVSKSAAEGAEKRKLVFKRNEANKWVAPPATEESKAFADLTEALWHAKATEVLPIEVKDSPLANPTIEVRVYRRLYNDPKGDEKEKERIATYRFASDAAAQWFATGITGPAIAGGFATKTLPDLAAKITALAFPSAASQPASQPKPVESAPASQPATNPASAPGKDGK